MSANVIVVKNPLAEEKEDWGAALMGSAAVNKDLLLPHRFKRSEINEGMNLSHCLLLIPLL